MVELTELFELRSRYLLRNLVILNVSSYGVSESLTTVFFDLQPHFTSILFLLVHFYQIFY